MNGRFNVGGRVSVFQLLSRGSAARRVVAVGVLLLTLDVILSAAAQWLAAGRRIHFSYSLRHDASDIVGLALLSVLVLPSVAVVAHRSWHAVSRYSAREDGYERLNDDNELGLRKAKATCGATCGLDFCSWWRRCAKATSASSSASIIVEDDAQQRRADSSPSASASRPYS